MHRSCTQIRSNVWSSSCHPNFIYLHTGLSHSPFYLKLSLLFQTRYIRLNFFFQFRFQLWAQMDFANETFQWYYVTTRYLQNLIEYSLSKLRNWYIQLNCQERSKRQTDFSKELVSQIPKKNLHKYLRIARSSSY